MSKGYGYGYCYGYGDGSGSGDGYADGNVRRSWLKTDERSIWEYPANE